MSRSNLCRFVDGAAMAVRRHGAGTVAGTPFGNIMLVANFNLIGDPRGWGDASDGPPLQRRFARFLFSRHPDDADAGLVRYILGSEMPAVWAVLTRAYTDLRDAAGDTPFDAWGPGTVFGDEVDYAAAARPAAPPVPPIEQLLALLPRHPAGRLRLNRDILWDWARREHPALFDAARNLPRGAWQAAIEAIADVDFGARNTIATCPHCMDMNPQQAPGGVCCQSYNPVPYPRTAADGLRNDYYIIGVHLNAPFVPPPVTTT